MGLTDLVALARRCGADLDPRCPTLVVAVRLTTPGWVVAALERDPLLRAVVVGAPTHRWAECDACGEGTLVKGGNEPRCRMTPGCPGKHLSPAGRERRAKAARTKYEFGGQRD